MCHETAAYKRMLLALTESTLLVCLHVPPHGRTYVAKPPIEELTIETFELIDCVRPKPLLM